jgi:(p)ppGpp synthase/HD superfamily hydrolase
MIRLFFALMHLALIPQRILDVCWKENNEGGETYSSRLSVVVKNEAGGFANITSVIAKKMVNISDFRTTNRSSDYLEVLIALEVKSVDHLEEVMSALRISKKVVEVKRV